MEKEEWKEIEGFNGMYLISNKGRVKSYKQRKEKILTTHKTHGNYIIVNLSSKGKSKSYRLHRLVAKAFIPNVDDKPDVNHIDGDKSNNCSENLEWCTPQYNIKEAFRMGLNKPRKGTEHHLSRKVKQYDLDGNFIRKWDCFRDIERELGFKHSNISACCNGKYDKMYGYRWKYAEYIDKDIIANKINKNKELLDETNDGDLRQKIIVENEVLEKLLEEK